ncbi:hypothetical protein ACLB1Q_33265 [Escherichia coli]
MATGPKNAKSQSVTARIAHEIIVGIKNEEEEEGEVQGSCQPAMRGEIKRRQRRKAKVVGVAPPEFFEVASFAMSRKCGIVGGHAFGNKRVPC